jgi:uncharacterized phage protein (TIGR01671 family)
MIKFRIWDCNSFIFHYYALDNVPNKDIFNLNESNQFTGILDKNGKEIFEGDILAEKHDHASDYTGDEETYMKNHLVRKAPGYFYHDEDEPHGLIINTHKRINSYVEVVGNSWENPELVDPNDLI